MGQLLLLERWLAQLCLVDDRPRIPGRSSLECYSGAVLQGRSARKALVQSAMECVTEGMWNSTSLQAVRERAGVSNGSLFHHFPTRQDLTAAVVAEALEEHQRALLAQLGTDAQLGVTGAVRQHLSWVDDNRQVARLLLSTPPEVLRLSLYGPVLESNRRFFLEIEGWLREHGWRETVPLPVVLALWVGPAQEFSRQQLAQDDNPSVLKAEEGLCAGAWAALRPLLNDTATATDS